MVVSYLRLLVIVEAFDALHGSLLWLAGPPSAGDLVQIPMRCPIDFAAPRPSPLQMETTTNPHNPKPLQVNKTLSSSKKLLPG